MAVRLDHEIIELETRRSFRIARAGDSVRRSVWIRVRDQDDFEGWGEAATTTSYYGETAESASALIPRIAEVLEEEADGRVTAIDRIETVVENAIGYNPATRAGLSAALHDLFGKRLQAPIWALWGLAPKLDQVSSFTLAIDEPDAMRERLREAADYPILKIKLGTERDEEILGLIRDMAPNAVLRVDANTAWDAKQAIRKLDMLEAHGVELLEQPVDPDDLDGLELIRAESSIPIIADESCRTSEDIPGLAGRVDGINVKLAKCGSLREALQMVYTARSHSLKVMLGCMIESTLGIAAAIQLAPLADYVDLDGAALLANDPFTGPGLEPDGRLRFNSEPGLGVARA